MEKALKERIVGAVILVLFVVLVVPIFLDGPPANDAIVSERVLLPGQEGQEIKTVILDRERSVPLPATSSDTTAKIVTAAIAPTIAPEQATAEENTEEPAAAAVEVALQSTPEKTPAPASTTAVPVPTSTTGMWAVQLGSFSDKANAEKLAADLRKQEYAAFLSQLMKNGNELHRVRVGPQQDRQSAEAVAAKLLKRGHKGQVVPHP